ncbi:12041_t:CDS:2, partial [Racocetra persica]
FILSKKTDDHDHASQTDSGEIAQVVACIKQQACDIQDISSKIIQNNISTISKNLSPYMPMPEAFRMRIKRVRIAEILPQPQTLDET